MVVRNVEGVLMSACLTVALVQEYSALAEAEKGFKIRRYPYRRYNKLKLVSF